MNYLRNLWKFAASMRTAVIILSIIAAAAVIGTLLPRLAPSSENPLFHFLSVTLGFNDYYHAWWFRTLLLGLCLDVTICSALRFPRLWRETVNGHFPLCPGVWQNQAPSARPASEIRDRAAAWLKSHGYRVHLSGEQAVFGHKGRLSSWGVFVAHLAIPLVIAGGLWGSLSGFQYDVTLAEGESRQLRLADGGTATLRLASFTTHHYAGGQVAEWISRVVISQNDVSIADREILVNHPLLVRGVAIYQSAYSHRYHLRLKDDGPETKTYRLEEGRQYSLDEAGLKIIPLRFLTAAQAEVQAPQIVFAWFDRAGRSGIASATLGVPFSAPEHNIMLTFDSADDISGLFVKHDPGLPLVYAGFILLPAGFFLSLYIPRRRVWLDVFPDNSGCIVVWSLRGRFTAGESAAIQEILQQSEDRGDIDDLPRTYPC